MKKKQLLFAFGIIFTVSALLYTIFTINKVSNLPKKEVHQKTKSTFATFLQNKEWCRVSDTRGGRDYDSMSFTENSEFYYNCLCGEPVGNSDLYDSYELDIENKKIKLSGSKESTIDILSHNKYHILIRYEDKILDFMTMEMYDSVPEMYAECTNYFEDYSACHSFAEYKDNTLTIAPPNYDGETHQNEILEKVKVVENVKFESVSAIFTEADCSTKVTYEKIPPKEAIEHINTNGSFGFIWYNDKLEVTKIVFYGTTEIQ